MGTTARAPRPSGPPATGLAVVFGGQGSQRSGMARPWVDLPASRRWEEAEDLLGLPVRRWGLEADEDELREPLVCQVALFVHQVVVFEAWAQSRPEPLCAAGHSLGEYDALVAAGILEFSDALRLVHARASATAAAAARAPGGMSACVGHAAGVVERAAARAGAHVCNDNAPGQLVVAGDESALSELTRLLADEPGRVIRLQVGAAYHSPAMAPAVPALQSALEEATFRDGRFAVVANVDAAAHQRGSDWPELLARQVVEPVRWRETMATMVALGAGEQIECGASPVLTGLAKRAAPTLARTFVDGPSAALVTS